jgi:choline dehydrogenase-like flavoprotein
MIVDLHDGSLPAAIDTDVCVIGAGAAGICLSLSLAKRGAAVTLLESGGLGHESAIQDLNRAVVVGLSHKGVHEGRFRIFGGTTTRWGGQILPLHPYDFEAQPWIEDSGWPIRYDDLAPYYRSAIEFEALGDAIADDAGVWERIGLPRPRLGTDLQSFLTRWCPEPDFARLHGPEIRRLERLKCILHATVTAFSGNGPRITAVIAKTLGGRSISVYPQRVALCVGGIETARMLLHPLSDGTPAPWARLDAVGRYFQDHPGMTCADVIPRDRRSIHRLFDGIYHRGFRYRPKFKLNADRQRRLRTLAVGGGIIFQTAQADRLDRARGAAKALLKGRVDRDIVSAALGSAAASPLMLRQAWRTFVQRRAFNPDDLGIRLGVDVQQAPRRDSRVSLAETVDAFRLRCARLDWRMGEAEIASVAAFCGVVKTGFEAAGIAEVRIDPDVATRSPDVLARLHDQSHHIGTARMAVERDHGVVNPQLRIFGTENAFVCGSAVFPTSGFSNPTHTILALALRLSDHLLEDLKCA